MKDTPKDAVEYFERFFDDIQINDENRIMYNFSLFIQSERKAIVLKYIDSRIEFFKELRKEIENNFKDE